VAGKGGAGVGDNRRQTERVLDIDPMLAEAFDRCPAVDPVYWFGPAAMDQHKTLCRDRCALIREVTGLTGKAAKWHNLRHTFAINLLRAGTPVPVVSYLLGHRDIKTTMIYLRVESADARQAIAKLPVVEFTRNAPHERRREE
jgi:integrase